MATLEIEFNCMCVFVPDPATQSIHVLMPSTEHPLSGCQHGGPERHVVRMLHDSFTGTFPKGLSLEGWGLELDGLGGPADTSLQPTRPQPVPPPVPPTEIVDLSVLTGNRQLPRRLVEDGPDPEVNARITLRSGRISTAYSEAEWIFQGRSVRMAFRVVWEMDVDPDQELRWLPLQPTSPPPIRKLSELGSGPYRFAVYHVPDRALPPDPADAGRLTPALVKDHFRALYVLFGIGNPGEDLLPQPLPGIGNAHCGSSQASVPPPPPN
jgi:hypothetical protein